MSETLDLLLSWTWFSVGLLMMCLALARVVFLIRDLRLPYGFQIACVVVMVTGLLLAFAANFGLPIMFLGAVWFALELINGQNRDELRALLDIEDDQNIRRMLSLPFRLVAAVWRRISGKHEDES